MSENSDDEKRAKMRRTIHQEFSRMEEDFDGVRIHRDSLVNKLVQTANNVLLVDKDGNTREDTDVGVRIITSALKALTDVEKANAMAIGLKLKQNEQAIASSATTRDRIAIILQATKPGQITQDFPSGELEEHLSEMFDADIKDFELKSNPRSLDDSSTD